MTATAQEPEVAVCELVDEYDGNPPKKMWRIPDGEGGELQAEIGLGAKHFEVGTTVTIEEPWPEGEEPA